MGSCTATTAMAVKIHIVYCGGGGDARDNRLPGGGGRGRCCLAQQKGRRWIRRHIGEDEQDLRRCRGGSCLTSQHVAKGRSGSLICRFQIWIPGSRFQDLETLFADLLIGSPRDLNWNGSYD